MTYFNKTLKHVKYHQRFRCKWNHSPLEPSPSIDVHGVILKLSVAECLVYRVDIHTIQAARHQPGDYNSFHIHIKVFYYIKSTVQKQNYKYKRYISMQ